MYTMYSNKEDCKKLRKLLTSEIGDHIHFEQQGGLPNLFGNYFQYSFDDFPTYHDLERHSVSFAIKFLENGFLRVSVGDNVFCSISIGQKLAALSDFYQILVKYYGSPTFFYTLKNDEVGQLFFEWDFTEKQESVDEFLSDTVFDDAHIGELILFGETWNGNYKPQTEHFLAQQIGLPLELLPLLNKHIDEFLPYRKQSKIEIEKPVEYTKK